MSEVMKEKREKKDGKSKESKTNPSKNSSMNLSKILQNKEENDKEIEEITNIVEEKIKTLELRDKLSPIIQAKEEKKKIFELYENENNVIDEFNNENNQFYFDDFIFEERATKILSEVYDLKEYILYPYFKVESSEKKRKNVLKVYYNRIDFQINTKREFESENNLEKEKDSKSNKSIEKAKPDIKPINEMNSSSSVFLDDIKAHMAKFQNIKMIFNKNKNEYDTVAVISKNFDFFTEFQLKKDGNSYKVSIPFNEIDDKLIDIKSTIQKIENQIASSKDENEKIKLQNDLNNLNTECESIKNELSENNIRKNLSEKKEELNLIENNSDKLNDNDEKKKIF